MLERKRKSNLKKDTKKDTPTTEPVVDKFPVSFDRETIEETIKSEMNREAELLPIKKQAEETRKKAREEKKEDEHSINYHYRKTMKEAYEYRFSREHKLIKEIDEKDEEKEEFKGNLIEAIKKRVDFALIKELISKQTFSSNPESKLPIGDMNINTLDENGYNALHYAVMTRRYPSDVILTRKDTPQERKEKEGALLILKNKQEEELAIIKLLLENGADPRILNAQGQNLIEMAAIEEREAHMMSFLLNAFPQQCLPEKYEFIKSCFEQKNQPYPNRKNIIEKLDTLNVFNSFPPVSFYARYPEVFFEIINHCYSLAKPYYQDNVLAMLNKTLEARISPTNIDFPVKSSSVALVHALSTSAPADILLHIMSKGGDPRDLVTCQATLPGNVKKHYQSSMLLLALDKANAETIHFFLDAFPLQCQSASHIPFALQAQKIMSDNKNLKSDDRDKLLSRITTLENYVTRMEGAIHHALPDFIKIFEKASDIDSLYYHEQYIELIKKALTTLTKKDARIINQLHFLEGKLLYKKGLSTHSTPAEKMNSLAAAFVAWNDIRDISHLTTENNLFLAKQLLSVSTQPDIAMYLSYQTHYQRHTKIINHLIHAKENKEASELLIKIDERFSNNITSDSIKVESMSIVNDASELPLKRLNWKTLNSNMWTLLCFLIKKNALGNATHPIYKLYSNLTQHKLEAEINTDKRVENSDFMYHEVTKTIGILGLGKKSSLAFFSSPDRKELLTILNQLKNTLEGITSTLKITMEVKNTPPTTPTSHS